MPTPFEGPAIPDPPEELTPTQARVAELYGRRYRESYIVKVMAPRIYGKVHKKNQRTARLLTAKLFREWKKKPAFRDYVYELAVAELDMASPEILKGVVGAAKRGRVDAAKFAMELAGRYSPKGEQQAGNVMVVIGGMPRPAVNTSPLGPDGDGPPVVVEPDPSPEAIQLRRELMPAEDEDE